MFNLFYAAVLTFLLLGAVALFKSLKMLFQKQTDGLSGYLIMALLCFGGVLCLIAFS